MDLVGAILSLFAVNQGEIGDPWGTPFLMCLVVDDWPLNDTWALLPAWQLLSHLLVLLCMFVSYILFVRLCRGMASNALLMSNVTSSVL